MPSSEIYWYWVLMGGARWAGAGGLGGMVWGGVGRGGVEWWCLVGVKRVLYSKDYE